VTETPLSGMVMSLRDHQAMFALANELNRTNGKRSLLSIRRIDPIQLAQ
jgi:hypothetical protein